VASALAINADQKDLRLHVYIDPALPHWVLGDQVRIRQVLFNLLGNAIKFTEKGRVLMRADRLPDSTDSRVVVGYRIIDNGIGMTDAQVAKLFTPFTQAEASTTRRFGGTGLGLSIVKRLLDLMDGKVSVSSEAGVGSEFRIILSHDIPEGVTFEWPFTLDDIRVLALVKQGLRTEIIERYLEDVGASVKVTDDLDQLLPLAQAATAAGAPYHVVWMGLDWLDNLRSDTRESFRQIPDLAGTRFVLARRQGTDGTTIEIPDTTLVPVNPLKQVSLLTAIAIAVGRASPDIQYASDMSEQTTRKLLSVRDAEAAGELILVAEDNVTNQDVVRRQLALLGYAVEIANDGEEALEMMTRRHYGMLLTDCHMPNLDGYDLTRRIRENEKGSAVRLPVVAMTANALAGEAEKCLGVGMDDYMSKPVELKKLDEMIAHWMPSQSGETEAAGVAADVVTAGEQAPSAPADGSAPGDDGVIDVEAIKALLGDDMSFIMQMLNDFVPAATANAGEITDAAEAGDAAAAGAAAHKLKSSSRSMGANTLADLCEEIENAGKAGDQATVDALMVKLTPALDDVTAHVETMNS
jgi:CheY-like chemotaxis protein/HPt (histidine-containing phosphotransfer) domain-containing protein